MPAEISTSRRLVLLAGCVLPSLMASAFVVVTVWSVMTMARELAGGTRQFLDLKLCVDRLQSMKRDRHDDGIDRSLEIYIAGRFKPLVNNPQAWNNERYKGMLTPAQRHMVESIIASSAAATEKEFNEASDRVRPLGVELKTTDAAQISTGAMAMAAGVWACMTGLPALIAAVLFRGGVLMRGLGSSSSPKTARRLGAGACCVAP